MSRTADRMQMMKALILAVVPAIASALAVGCSSSDKPALCSSIDQLKTSVNQLTDVQSGENGLGGLESNLAAVKTDLNKVLDDAKSQYSTQVAQIRSDMSSLQSAIDAAKGTHSAADISVAVTAAKTLGGSVKGLAEDAKSTC